MTTTAQDKPTTPSPTAAKPKTETPTKPVETKPTEASPVAAKPGDPKPAVTKPVDPKPVDNKPKKPELDTLAALPAVRGTTLGGYDHLIEQLVKGASDLPKHALAAGIPLYAQVTPFANHPTSPMRTAGTMFSARRDALLNSMRPIFNAAKYVFDSVSFAQQAEKEAAGKFVSKNGKSLSGIANDMKGILDRIALFEAKLLADPNAEIGELPGMPDYADIPVRLWSGDKGKIAPPDVFSFTPSDLVVRTLAAFKTFSAIKVAGTDTDFKQQGLTYLKGVNELVRSTYVDIVGFIDDLNIGLDELLAGGPHSVVKDLQREIANKSAKLTTGLKQLDALLIRIEERSKTVVPPAAEDDAWTAALDSLIGEGNQSIAYRIHGHGGDMGGLPVFWQMVAPMFGGLAKTLATVSVGIALTDLVEVDSDAWKRVRKEYSGAAAAWESVRI